VTGGNFTELAGTGVGANAGTITVESGALFTVGGTVKNSGIITLNGTGELSIYRDTILQGGGKITLSNNLANQNTNIGGGSLTNVGNVISGSGYIAMALVNQNKGVIDANGTSSLVVNEKSGISLTNAGLLESTSTGGLVLGGTINNSASGVIGAFGAGSNVSIGPSGTLSGGTLKTTGGGQILISAETIDGSNGRTVTNTGNVLVNGAILLGTISNTGTIALNDGIAVGAGGATLAGSGNVTLSDSTTNSILGNGANTTLTNQNTISGAGEIGGNGLLLTNQGVIDATGTNPLIVDTAASPVTNTGTLEATSNATLFVASNVTNTGHLIANNGDVIFAGAVSGTGTATIQGAGSIEFGSTTTSNVTFAAGADGTVTFDAASTLTGKLSITGFTLGDTIDLADINFSGSGPTLTFNKGILTVSDGTDTAQIRMIGNFTLASFHAASDGSGGTLITDPPPTSPPTSNSSANVALNENITSHGFPATDPPQSTQTIATSSPTGITGGSGADTFIFPPHFGENTITNFDVQNNTIELPHSEFASVAAVLADIHRVGANVEIAPDPHDVITLNNVTAAQLHASNFHLV